MSNWLMVKTNKTFNDLTLLFARIVLFFQGFFDSLLNLCLRSSDNKSEREPKYCYNDKYIGSNREKKEI